VSKADVRFRIKVDERPDTDAIERAERAFFDDPDHLHYRECASCAAKTGSPTLCPSCYHNRTVIDRLRERLGWGCVADRAERERRAIEALCQVRGLDWDRTATPKEVVAVVLAAFCGREEG
jgi:hypothetical protein